MTCFIATYDISIDATREVVARILIRYGQRIQRSVFLVWLDNEELTEVRRAIGPALQKTDSFDLIPVDLDPNRDWFGWQRKLDAGQPVRVYW